MKKTSQRFEKVAVHLNNDFIRHWKNNDISEMAPKPDVGWSTCNLILNDIKEVGAQRLEPIDPK